MTGEYDAAAQSYWNAYEEAMAETNSHNWQPLGPYVRTNPPDQLAFDRELTKVASEAQRFPYEFGKRLDEFENELRFQDRIIAKIVKRLERLEKLSLDDGK